MSPLGNEDARAQVGTNGGLSQRWRESADKYDEHFYISKDRYFSGGNAVRSEDADMLDAAKLRIEEAVRALRNHTILDSEGIGPWVDREAVLKIFREIL